MAPAAVHQAVGAVQPSEESKNVQNRINIISTLVFKCAVVANVFSISVSAGREWKLN